MSAERRHEDRRLLALALGVLAASATLGAAIGSSSLGLMVPPANSGSFADAMSILTNNLEIFALIAMAALFQPRGIPSLSRGFLPLWLTDLTVGLIVTLNLVAIGGALGALGLHAVLRVIPHAPLEIGGYLVAVIAYLRARRGRLEARDTLFRFALAAALLVSGAFVESYVSGGL